MTVASELDQSRAQRGPPGDGRRRSVAGADDRDARAARQRGRRPQP